MVCPQCNAVAKSTGGRCRLHTCKYFPRCHFHTDVEVKKSNIPNAGSGLFTKHAVKENQIISSFAVGTEPLSEAAFVKKYPTKRAHYVAQIGPVFYDASNKKKSVVGNINRPPKGKRANAKLTGAGNVKMKQNLPPGREIYMAYQNSFKL